MTSETKFAQEHTSTWRLLTPAMDIFVRKINLQLYEREFAVLQSAVAPSRRGLVNEVAFNVYSYAPDSDQGRGWSEDIFSRAVREAREKIASLETVPVETVAAPDQVEIDECAEQVWRLRLFFRRVRGQQKVEIRPFFPGSGIIRSCEGDVYCDSTLFEVKAGQRNFRAVDVRQLLTYAALNYEAKQRVISKVGLFNPRMGISFKTTLDEACIEVSGVTAAELMPEIIRIISSGDVSR